MTQEQKDLLLKDICGRIPYSVKYQCFDERTIVTLTGVKSKFKLYFDELDYKEFDGIVNIDYCKPYLFPLSSMTEEQKYNFYCRFIESDYDFDDFKEFYLDNGMWHKLFTTLEDIEAIIDWFHKNHFDYRGLISIGLAIDATDKNIY